MKKILLATAIALGTTAAASTMPAYDLTAQAVSASDFEKALKKGKLPGAKGHVGITYKQLKKVAPNASKWQNGDPFGGVEVGRDNYGFNTGKPSAHAQVISRDYKANPVVTRSALEKKIGKPYKIYQDGGFTCAFYKKGKYALLVIWRPSSYKSTTFIVGTPRTVDYIPL